MPETFDYKKIGLSAAIVLIALFFLAKTLPSKPQETKQEDIARVQVARAVYASGLARGIQTTASLKAAADVIVRTKVESHLQNIYVKKGQMFQKGELLLELEHNTQSAQVKATEAQLKMNEAEAESAKFHKENASAEQKRYDTLIEKGYATRQEVDAKRTASQTAGSDYDKAVANIAYARSQLEAMQAALADYMVYAPFDGIVLDDYDISVGQQVTKDTDVMRIADIRQIKAFIEIPETRISRVKKGMEVEVTCDALPDRRFRGTVENINEFVNTGTHMVRADVVIDNSAVGYALKPGMFARCFVVEETASDVLVVPTEAVRDDSSVFVVRDNKAQQVQVTVELKQEKETAVSGINEGDLVIVRGGKNIKSGDKVTYKEEL